MRCSWLPLTFVALALAACGGEPECSARPQGLERDRCLHDRALALPAAQSADVLVLVKQIEDPIVRGAAVYTWVGQNNRDVSQRDGQALCELLDGREKVTCVRKLSSVHLLR